MDPEFTRVVLRVAILGGAILAIGAGLLVIAFRAFASDEARNRDFRPALLVAAVLLFVLMACALLLRLAMVK